MAGEAAPPPPADAAVAVDSAAAARRAAAAARSSRSHWRTAASRWRRDASAAATSARRAATRALIRAAAGEWAGAACRRFWRLRRFRRDFMVPRERGRTGGAGEGREVAKDGYRAQGEAPVDRGRQRRDVAELSGHRRGTPAQGVQ